MEDADSKYIVKIKTVQIAAFKTLIEALKEIFRDLNIRFLIPYNDKTKQEGGISISAMNSNGNVYVKLKLPSKNFEEYICRPKNGESSVIIGVNMSHFYKLIKTMNDEDNLTLFVEENRINELGIKLENPSRQYRTVFRLNLLDLDREDPYNIPEAKFNFVITMLSSDLHNLIKNMSTIAENVDIKYIDIPDMRNTLIFNCKGEFASQETIFADNSKNNNLGGKESSSIKITQTTQEDNCSNEIIQGVYQLKTLSLFSKCSSLCNNLEIYIKNNYPLVIKYMVANLGYVYLILSSVAENNNYKECDASSESEDEI